MVPVADADVDRTPRGRGVVPALIVLILLSLALSQSVGWLNRYIGIDFYNYWSVPVARRLASHTLGSPYTNAWSYIETLTDYAERTNDLRLKAANKFLANNLAKGPDYTVTPLLLTVFTAVSSSYTVALLTFQTLQLVLFLGSFLLLGYLYRFDAFYLACLALLCVLFYQPLLSDVRVANLGCFQLAWLTGLLGLAAGLARASSFAWRATLGGVFLTAVAALTLCKPNVAVISALLVAHLAVRHGARLFLVSALPAGVAAAVFVIIPCVYFGSWSVWREFYDFVYGANAYRLVLPMAHGNFSTALLLSSWLGLDVYTVSTVLMALLGVSLLAAVTWSRGFNAPAGSSAGIGALGVLQRILGDPRMALAIGIVLTMATSPLYWFHYFVLSLIPILWFLSGSASTKYVAGLAATTLVVSSQIFSVLIQWPDALMALSWLPLWGAILLRITSPVADAMTAREASATKTAFTDARAVVSPRPRRRKR